MIARLTIAASLVAAAASLAAASPCPDVDLHPKVLTPDKTAVTDGVVVGWTAAWQRGTLPYDEDATKWKAAGKAVARKVLAPGLEVLSGDPNATTIVDKAGTSIVTFSIDTSMLLPAVPAPTKITVTRTQASKSARHRWVSTVAHLAAAPPSDAVALVVLANGKPVSFGAVTDPKSREVVVYNDNTCNPQPKGTVDEKGGAKVKLAWVVASGRMSAPSAAIEIKGVIDK